MEAVGLALSVAQTLFAALQSSELKQIFSIFGYESELDRLQETVKRINAVLQDADGKKTLSYQERDLVEKLKDAVYDADDLLDKFKTLVEREELLLNVQKGSKLRKKVRRIISRFGKLGDAYDMTREVKKIRENLESIADAAAKFNIDVDNQPIRRRRDDTCSYVYEQDVIGREDDLNKVIDFLLDAGNNNDAQGNLRVISIVGMGGMGKTTLAQLVLNDKLKIQHEFPLRLWACVADEDQRQLDVQGILAKILESAIHEKFDGLSLELMHSKLAKELEQKKYLLVLDDVWTENRAEWMKLEKLLKGLGCGGSGILVTTRSEETARAVGNGHNYMLDGLKKENSWRLFKLVAFGQEQEQSISSELLEIGRDIVDKCAGVPLAIRVVGSLLYGQHKDKWLALKQKGLASIRKDKNNITTVLKLSYHNLESPLRNCFSYCALFPKDTVIPKAGLISLWMAQGFIVPLDAVSSIEEAAEDYFLILLRRCFFQDVERNVHDEIVSCKIHDLMHVVAGDVAGMEISIVDYTTSNLVKKVRHAYDFASGRTESFFAQSRMRTYLRDQPPYDKEFAIDALLGNWLCLRALELSRLGLKVLPDTVGKLLHLRFLDLSDNNSLEILPESITKLYNLQTLNLRSCSNLKELPRDLSQLVKLRVLNVEACFKLTCMPPGMRKLTCLHTLPMFVVGQVNRGSSSKQLPRVGEMEDLRVMNNLKGRLTIRVGKDHIYVKEDGKHGGYLSNKERLTQIDIEFTKEDVGCNAEAFIEDLQPHFNLRYFGLVNYCGARPPRWLREDKLPNLVAITIAECPRLLELPILAKLPFLKELRLYFLHNLEYVECTRTSSWKDSRVDGVVEGAGALVGSDTSSTLFFPTLEQLVLNHLPKFKGWWKGSTGWSEGGGGGDADNGNHNVVEITEECSSKKSPFRLLPSSFPRLKNLEIWDCPNLRCMPGCPMLETLVLRGEVNKRLRIVIVEEGENKSEGTSDITTQLPPLMEENSGNPKLRELITGCHTVGCLKSNPNWAFSCLVEMVISDDWVESKLDNLSGFGEVFRGCSSSLRSLKISWCSLLRSLEGGGLEHLTSLESLELRSLLELAFEEEKEEDGVPSPWKSFAPSIRRLKFESLPNLRKLPKWMRHFTSLTQLELLFCPWVLRERCREPDGEDWPLILHIPNIHSRDYWK